MKIFKKSFLVIISLLLCLTVMTQTVCAAFTGPKPLYVADIKLIYADNANKAKEQLPQGYQLLESDLNTGTGDGRSCYAWNVYYQFFIISV